MISNIMENIYEFASTYKNIMLVPLKQICNVDSKIEIWVEELIKLEEYNKFCQEFKYNLDSIIYKKNHKQFTQSLALTLRTKRSDIQMKYLKKKLKENFLNIRFYSQWKRNNRQGVKVKIKGKSSFSMIVDSWCIEKYRNSYNLCFGYYGDPEYHLVEVMGKIEDDEYYNYDYDDGVRRYKDIYDLIYNIVNYFK